MKKEIYQKIEIQLKGGSPKVAKGYFNKNGLISPKLKVGMPEGNSSFIIIFLKLDNFLNIIFFVCIQHIHILGVDFF